MPISISKYTLLMLFILLLAANQKYFSQSKKITLKQFEKGKTILLDDWEIKFGEKDPGTNFSETLGNKIRNNSLLYSDSLIKKYWTGTAYFQTKIYSDTTLAGKTLAFTYTQGGASEIFLNGEQIYTIGTIFPSASNEYSYYDRLPRVIKLETGFENTITVRYSNHRLEEFWDEEMWGGFVMTLGFMENMNETTLAANRLLSTKQIVFIVIPATLAVLHFFLFLFDRKQKQNLIYSLFLTAFLLFIYADYQIWFVNNLFHTITLSKISFTALLLSVYLAVISIRLIFTKISKLDFFNFFITLGVIFYLYFDRNNTSIITSYILISFLFSIAGSSIFRPSKKNGVWILRWGFILMSASGIYQMMLTFNFVPPLFNETAIYVYGVTSFILSMSIYLAYEFIRTGRELELKIEEVKNLSRENLEKELLAKENEAKNKILEADNERKTRELEDARKLQLSMLPRRLPETKFFDISVKMETAVEVGGDYYDIFYNDSGILNLALGDATGHGNKAGIMVAITKSMFTSLGSNLLIPDFFKKCTAVIKRMKLGNLFMSLSIIRTNGRSVIFSAAGMPPILHYQKNKKSIKQRVLKSMPLGASLDFPYDTIEFDVEPEDVLLLFSDGIVELFNKKNEIFGLERLINILKDSVEKSPEKIIETIFKAGKEWSGEESPNDDITIVAMKVK